MSMMTLDYSIPQPKTYGPLGNLPIIDKKAPSLSFAKLAEEYGPIYRFVGMGRTMLVVSSPEYATEVCDKTRFEKSVGGALKFARAFGGDGLFTAETHEPNWRKAHNILMPCFSQSAMKGYHPMMLDLAEQLIQKWSRLNPGDTIDVAADMTLLTLDTIGLCGFNYRFNSFYRDQPHFFITSMNRALSEAMKKFLRPAFLDKLMIRKNRQFYEDINTMFTLVDPIIAERRASGEEGNDLLSNMLYGIDPETGEGLDDRNIRFQIITFLIAGHETTSGLLSFALYFLMKNPDTLKKAYEEVDRVLTDSHPTYEQVLDLKYVRMVLHESLRLWPTAPVIAFYAKEDTVLGGKYKVKKDERVSIILPALHRDKGAWGDDANEFKPERFRDMQNIPHEAYKPFGQGQRACIGKQFALHEATLVLGMILKHFELIDHTNYQLKIKQTMTLKPDEFMIQVGRRNLN